MYVVPVCEVSAEKEAMILDRSSGYKALHHHVALLVGWEPHSSSFNICQMHSTSSSFYKNIYCRTSPSGMSTRTMRRNQQF